MLFGKKWMHCSGWKRQEVGDEFMLEFVKVTMKKKVVRLMRLYMKENRVVKSIEKVLVVSKVI